MQSIDQFLAHYGYFALFALLMFGIVGPLIPDETILVLAGIAIHHGQMHAATSVVVAFAGSLCGITLSYLLGRTGAVYVITKIPWVRSHADRHLPQAHDWFERYGKWTLFFGYFIAGVRHFTALAAGMSGVPPRTFALYAYPGGFIWVVCFLAIGYYLGEKWRYLSHRLDAGIVILAILIVAAALLWHYLRRKSKD